jgi:hypothetical protein
VIVLHGGREQPDVMSEHLGLMMGLSWHDTHHMMAGE